MSNKKLIRPVIFIFAAAIHAAIILFAAFEIPALRQETNERESPRIMQLIAFQEAPTPPPASQTAESAVTRALPVAAHVITSDTLVEQAAVQNGSVAADAEEVFLAAHLVSTPPLFDAVAIRTALVYPPIALRAGIEGRVILELFVDRSGEVRRIIVLREEPEGHGFAEAAIRAFTDRRAAPATVNGEPVGARFRYPVSFQIR